MKINKTFLFAVLTLLTVFSVYVFDYKTGEKDEKLKQAPILNFDINQISYIQIVKTDGKIGLQKSVDGWSLLEPFQDRGDNEKIEEFLSKLADEKQVAEVRKSEMDLTEKDLKEYGLDKPLTVFNFKNNLGNTKKVSVGAVKNFEGNSYLRVDSENKIIIGTGLWHALSENDMIYYREKKLYRGNLARVVKIKVKSLQDEFELKRVDGKWINPHFGFELDQARVRDLLKNTVETSIEQYLFEGEPSVQVLNEKGLSQAPVTLELITDDANWAAHFNLKTEGENKGLFALTERPTYLVRTDMSAWETFGNLTLDSLRDRSSVLAFNLDEVKKIYYKQIPVEMTFLLKDDVWKAATAEAGATYDEAQIKRTLYRIHDLKISEFIDDPTKHELFEGKNMLILKSDTDKLVLQLNWGPAFKMKKGAAEKEYYYARTQLSDVIFALEKSVIESLGFDKIKTGVKSVNGAQIETH